MRELRVARVVEQDEARAFERGFIRAEGAIAS
jgi:hypothetical protein